MTNPNGLVLDVFQFTDEERFLELNADGEGSVPERPRAASSRAASTSPSGCAPARRASCTGARGVTRDSPPVFTPTTNRPAATRFSISLPTTHSGCCTAISRVISHHGCDVDLVLISTEGDKAIDVFHITKAGAKLTDAASAEVTADFHRTLEA